MKGMLSGVFCNNFISPNLKQVTKLRVLEPLCLKSTTHETDLKVPIQEKSEISYTIGIGFYYCTAPNSFTTGFKKI